MVRVWKIGSEPGISKAKFRKAAIVEKNGFSAIGWSELGDSSDVVNIDAIQDRLVSAYPDDYTKGHKNTKDKAHEIWYFSHEIDSQDIILQYFSKNEVYIGKVTKPYYYVPTNKDYWVPHRINVEWQMESNDKPKPFKADFHDWEDTIHEVTLSDLSREMDEELRGFISDVLNRKKYGSGLIKSVGEPTIDTKKIIEDDTDENTEKRFKDVDKTLKSKSPDVLEGIERVKEAVFISKSRNRKIIDDKKWNSNYTCEVCGFNFEKMYGDIGKKFIVAHHLRPIGTRGEKGEITRQEDIALVCENCHRMLHIRGHQEHPYTIEELKNRISKEKGIL